MKKKDIKKMAYDNPNDFVLGGKIRQMITEPETEVQIEEEPDWKDMYLRLSAEFDNYRKRVSKEKDDLVLKTKSSMIESILDMDSDVSIAAKYSEDSGIKLIASKLEKFLDSNGIKAIQTDTYDEENHEVISIVAGEPGKIVNVAAKGYIIGDKVIRYPKVIISK
jgi:molecular chaperone GrpE